MTSHIQDDAVTTPKIDDDAVTSAKIDDGTIVSADLAVMYRAGSADILTDGSGDGSVIVSVASPSFTSPPTVVATAKESVTAGVFYVDPITASSFTINVSGSSVAPGTLTICWVAIGP